MFHETRNMNMEHGKVLVSEDPSTWRLPASLVSAMQADPEADPVEILCDWWDGLRSADDRIHEAFPSATVEDLKSLAAQFDMIWCTYTGTLDEQRAIRAVVHGIIMHGLSTDQAARLACVTRHDIIRLLLPTVNVDHDEYTKRVQMETLLRQGVSHAEISRTTGIPRSTVTYWAGTLGIASKTNGIAPEIRERALALHDSGSKVPAIVAALEQEYPKTPVKPMTVHKWISRYRKGK